MCTRRNWPDPLERLSRLSQSRDSRFTKRWQLIRASAGPTQNIEFAARSAMGKGEVNRPLRSFLRRLHAQFARRILIYRDANAPVRSSYGSSALIGYHSP